MSTRLGFVTSEPEHPEDISGSLQGILGCLEVGLAHLSSEQRQLYDNDAEPDLLLAPLEESVPSD